MKFDAALKSTSAMIRSPLRVADGNATTFVAPPLRAVLCTCAHDVAVCANVVDADSPLIIATATARRTEPSVLGVALRAIDRSVTFFIFVVRQLSASCSRYSISGDVLVCCGLRIFFTSRQHSLSRKKNEASNRHLPTG